MPEPVLFDRYRLLERAGRGGSADVWRAIDETTGETVAVKRLHPLVVADDAGRRRLRREFDALRSLDEPHIVRVRDLHVSENEAAMILDYVPGEALSDRLGRERAAGHAMPPEIAVGIVRDVAAALDVAHRAGIVHRDVTPGNILLAPDGVARLTDFGISQDSGDATAITGRGLVMGTMRYLAPEQLRGEQASPASDVHGLAVVAYEMLAGRQPYDAATPVALVEAQAAGPAPLAGVAPALDVAVRRGLAADPADRPASAGGFADSLAAAIDQSPTAAIPIEPIQPTAAQPLSSAATAAAIRSEVPASATEAGRARTVPTGRARRASGAGRALGLSAPIAMSIGLAVAAVALIAAVNLNHPTPDGGDARATAPPSRPVSTAPAALPSTSVKPTTKPKPTPKPPKDHGGKGKGHDRGG